MPGLSNQTFEYIGMGQSYTVPISGEYLLEVWGAQGGYAVGKPNANRTPENQPISQARGGLGGYTKGKIRLEANQVLYVFVGGQGNNYIGSTTSPITGGFNGGGSSMGCNTEGGGGGGGGATHISTQNSVLESCSLSKVLIVSGGGGGAWGCYAYSWSYTRGLSEGGQGGGKEGGRAGYGGSMGYTTDYTKSNIYNNGKSESAAYNYATGGTQTEGGTQGCASGSNSDYKTASPAKFGKGADSAKAGSHSGGGGGSGLYGGGAGASGTNDLGTGGGGGSSYISVSMYDTEILQGVREGHGKAVISPISIALKEYETLVNCHNYYSFRMNNFLLVFISMY